MRFGLRHEPASSDDDDEEEERVPVVPLPRVNRTTPARRPPASKLSAFKLPTLSRGRRSLVADSSSSSSDNDDDDDDEQDDDEDLDSEEEAWPVGPSGSFGIRGRVDRKAKHTPIVCTVDHLDKWDDASRQQSWANANKTFRLSLARSTSVPPRTAPVNPTRSDDVNSINSLLARLALEHSRESQLLVSAFERRNKSLWDSIEQSIKLAEDEQRELEQKRVKELEQERRAHDMRQAELARQQAERERVEDERKRVERENEAARLEAERVKLEYEAKQAEADKKTSAIRGPTTGEGSPKAEFEKWTAKMTHIKETVLPAVSQNPALRKACFQAKRSITPKIGQLTSSVSAIARIIAQLDDLLQSIDRQTPAYVWTLNHLSKSLIKQAETEVTAKLGTAYPLGRVVVGLLLRGHTELGQVLMARLVKKCFWITGYWPSKLPGQTEESYQKTLGYTVAHESSVQYSERMSGLVALYAAIIDSSPIVAPQTVPAASSTSSTAAETFAQVPPWFRPSAAWRFLILVSRPPLVSLEPAPLVILQFLSIAHVTLQQTYGKQFFKFVQALLNEGIRGKGLAGFDSKRAKASIVRLELWLEEYERERGRIKPVQGRECDE